MAAVSVATSAFAAVLAVGAGHGTAAAQTESGIDVVVEFFASECGVGPTVTQSDGSFVACARLANSTTYEILPAPAIGVVVDFTGEGYVPPSATTVVELGASSPVAAGEDTQAQVFAVIVTDTSIEGGVSCTPAPAIVGTFVVTATWDTTWVSDSGAQSAQVSGSASLAMDTTARACPAAPSTTAAEPSATVASQPTAATPRFTG